MHHFGYFGKGEEVVCTIAQASFDIYRKHMKIACLTFDNNIWSFQYTYAFKNQNKLVPILVFPDVNVTYSSKELWPFFLARIPSLKQPDIRKELKLDNTQQKIELVDLLTKYGEKSINNSLIMIRQK